VMRYFFKGWNEKARLGRAVEFTREGSGGSLGLGFRLGVRLFVGLRVAFRLGLVVGLFLRRLGALVLEVGGVPAASLELEAGGAQKLLKSRLAAHRALGERRFVHPLQELLLVPAGLTAIFVDRHGSDYIADFRKEYRLPSHQTCPPASSPLRPAARR